MGPPITSRLQRLFVKLAVLEHMADHGANQCVVVAVNAAGFTGHGGYPRDQRLALYNGAFDGVGSAYIDADHAYIGGQATAGYFLAGEYINQLLFTAGGVFGRKRHHRDTAALHMGLQGLHGLGLVVFNANHNIAGVAENLTQYTYTLDNLCGALADGRVVGGDIGLALGGIDNQRMYRPLDAPG